MLPKEVINIRQFTILVILLTIGDAILISPSMIVFIALQDAWISALIGLCIGLLVICLFVIVGKLQPKRTLIQLFEKTFGKWLGALFSICFLSFLFLSAVAHIRELSDFMTTQILPTTPIQVIHLLFIGIIVLGVRLGLEPLARTAEILFPLASLFLIILIILSLFQIEPILIQPIMTNGLKAIMLGSLPATTVPFLELIVFLMIFPFIKEQHRIRNNFLLGASIGGFILVIIVGLCILVLGTESTANDVYPTFTLARIVHIDDILQRMEGILAITWTITMYFKISLYVYALHIGLAQLFKLNTYRPLILPIGMILFACALSISPNSVYLFDIITKYWPFYDITIAVILPLLLLAVYHIRKRNKWI